MASQRTESSSSDPLRPLSAELREQLILEHLPRVKLIARKIYERLPLSIAFDDLISAGVIGLITAIDHRGSHPGVTLKTYAEHKIRSAILDSLRTTDWAPRQQRKRARLIKAAISILEQEHHRMPTEEEIAGELHLSIAEYRDWASELGGVTLGTVENAGPSTGMQSSALPESNKDADFMRVREKDLLASSRAGRKESATSYGLSETESGHHARSLMEEPVVQILMAAAAAFQELETGRSWLLTPSPVLGNVAPVSLISTQAGRDIVANELGLIEHGMF